MLGNEYIRDEGSVSLESWGVNLSAGGSLDLRLLGGLVPGVTRTRGKLTVDAQVAAGLTLVTDGRETVPSRRRAAGRRTRCACRTAKYSARVC